MATIPPPKPNASNGKIWSARAKLDGFLHRARARRWKPSDVVNRAVQAILKDHEDQGLPAGTMVVTASGEPGLLRRIAPSRQSVELSNALADEGWSIEASRIAIHADPRVGEPVEVVVTWRDPRPERFHLRSTFVDFTSDGTRTRYHAGRGPVGRNLRRRLNDIVLPSHLLFVSRDAFALNWRDATSDWLLEVPGPARKTTSVVRSSRPILMCAKPLPLVDGDRIGIQTVDGSTGHALTFSFDSHEVTS